MAVLRSGAKGEQEARAGEGAVFRADNLLRLLLLALGLLSLFITRQYGESWDELKFYKYADEALQAYVTWPSTGSIPLTGNTYDNYGPAYVMAVRLAARGLERIIPWTESDLRHLLYFFTFLAGIWSMYRIAKRWLRPTAALGATLLLASQPVLWGHAFISPKDIPFLSLFLLALDSGMEIFDRKDSSREMPAVPRSLTILTTLWLVGILLFFGGLPVIRAWLEGAVRSAAAGGDNLLRYIASDIRHTAPEIYIQRYFVWFLWARAAAFLLSGLGLILLYLRRAPGWLRWVGRLLLPAAWLGLAICVRLLGPLAGLLVALYALHKRGRAAIPTLLAYAGLAAAVMYATWPYLWPDPIGHFIESLEIMARYPWGGQVLFNGTFYVSTDIPRSYLPVLLGIQLTEPVWFLFAAGLAIVIREVLRRETASVELLWLTGLWFILPAAGFVALRSPLYDNFRQVFFILPPVFLMAGVVFDRIQAPVWKVAVMLACILPGIAGGLRLHPYEYIYYNRFIGGEAGAFRRFEMDYWGTSYREAAGWLNAHAPANASLWVDGPAHLLEIYLRPDLKLYSSYEAERAGHYDYSVSTSRFDIDLRSFSGAPIVHSIEREGAVLTVIKQPR